MQETGSVCQPRQETSKISVGRVVVSSPSDFPPPPDPMCQSPAPRSACRSCGFLFPILVLSTHWQLQSQNPSPITHLSGRKYPTYAQQWIERTRRYGSRDPLELALNRPLLLQWPTVLQALVCWYEKLLDMFMPVVNVERRVLVSWENDNYMKLHEF